MRASSAALANRRPRICWARPLGAALRAAAPLLLGALLALVAVEYTAPSRGPVGPFAVEVAARLALRGETTLAFPPFGEVSAATHPRVPLRVRFTLAGVDLPALRQWVGQTASAEAAWQAAENSLPPLAWRFILRTGLLAAVLGVGGARLAGRGWRGCAAGALGGLLAVAVLSGAVVAEFDRSAFERPRYQGALETAPWVVGLLEKNWEKVGTLGDQMQGVAQTLSGLSDRLGSLATVARPPQDLRILHVSDLHNNPVGVKFIAEAVRAFKVDAVLDTGDLTDWGTPLETDLVRDIVRLGVPYFFVPGNHDSPELLRELRRYPQVKVVDDRQVVYRGLVLFGAADPSARRDDPEPASPGELAREAEALAGRVEGLRTRPDVVAVHNAKLGAKLVGKVPVLLYGHDHRLSVKRERGTLLVDAGTTGAAGVRGLDPRREVPYSMVLLYFSRTPAGYRLRALDTLEVRDRTAGFALNRILVEDGGNPNRPGEPSGEGSGVQPATTGR
ncbi:MAG TPA: metallophosphoesterase [Firmicutes bacterium]|nr:metallophosphoesterase [Bacillota bacterium]